MIDILKKLINDTIFVKIYALILLVITLFFAINLTEKWFILYLMYIINFAFCIVILFKKNKFNSINKKCFIYALIYLILFLFMLPLTEVAKIPPIYSKLTSFTYFTLSFLSLLYLLYCAFSYESKDNDFILTNKFKIKILLIPTLVLVFMLFAAIPGLIDTDFIHIWNEFNTWHSMGFNLFVQFFKYVFNSIFLIRVVYFILLVYALYYSVNMLYRIVNSKKIIIVFTALLCFNIVYFQQLLFVWKNIIFGISFYILLLTMIEIYITKEFKTRLLVKLTFFAVLTASVIHFGIAIPLIGLSILIIIKKEKKYYIGILAFVLVFHFFISNIVPKKILKINMPPAYLKHSVSIQMLGSFATDESIKLTNDEKEYLESYMPIPAWKKLYQKYNSDAVAKNFENDETKEKLVSFSNLEIVKYNIHFLLKYPVKYVQNFFEYNNLLWKFNNHNWEVFHNDTNLVKKNDGQLYYDETYEISFLSKKVKEFNQNLFSHEFGRFFIRSAFPTYLLLLSFGLFIYKKRYFYSSVVGVLLIYLGSLFLSIPFPFTRYCIPFFDSYMFFFALALFIPKTTK